MYFGSVRFFKHLILSVLALLIIVPTVGCFYFAAKSHDLAQQLMVHDQAKGLALETVYASEEQNSLDLYSVPAYQQKHPHLMIENDFQYPAEESNMVYLTFDDGPSNLTPGVLDVLKRYDVHATFFVVYQNSADAKALYHRIVDEGHELAIHTASHNYKQIYESVEAYLDDFALLSDMLQAETGVQPEIFRFPGGSINNYNKEIHDDLISEMLRRGYTYYDWNVTSGSSTKTASKSSVYANVMNGVSGKSKAIVLMHDAGSSATVEALPDIIEALLASGYQFGVLDKSIKPICFDYAN